MTTNTPTCTTLVLVGASTNQKAHPLLSARAKPASLWAMLLPRCPVSPLALAPAAMPGLISGAAAMADMPCAVMARLGALSIVTDTAGEMRARNAGVSSERKDRNSDHCTTHLEGDHSYDLL